MYNNLLLLESEHDCEFGINKKNKRLPLGKRRLYVKGAPDSYEERIEYIP